MGALGGWDGNEGERRGGSGAEGVAAVVYLQGAIMEWVGGWMGGGGGGRGEGEGGEGARRYDFV